MRNGDQEENQEKDNLLDVQEREPRGRETTQRSKRNVRERQQEERKYVGKTTDRERERKTEKSTRKMEKEKSFTSDFISAPNLTSEIKEGGGKRLEKESEEMYDKVEKGKEKDTRKK